MPVSAACSFSNSCLLPSSRQPSHPQVKELLGLPSFGRHPKWGTPYPLHSPSSSRPHAQGAQVGTLGVPRAWGTDLTSTPPGPETLHTPGSPRAPPLSSPASPRETRAELAAGRDTGQPSRLPRGQAPLPGLGRHCPVMPTAPQRHCRRDPAHQPQPPSPSTQGPHQLGTQLQELA